MGEDGGMSDAIPPVDLASLAAAGGHPGALWRLDGEDLQANLVRLDQGDRIAPHRNDEVEVLVMVVSGRGELTVDGQVHQLAPMIVASLPKGTVRAVEAVDGPLAYLSVHRRRSGGCRWVGTPSDPEIPRGEPPGRSARADPPAGA
jgi:quercetin dioxygenase-like cupin family protein